MSNSAGTCHLPSCDQPRVTMTLCARHAERLLGRPIKPQADTERKEAA